jgi:cellulose synthase/poly-beta-1,6-N-acetylglucosamine synthase-like glycosyltransferase
MLIEFYGYGFTVYELVALGVLFVAFIYELYFYIRYLNGVVRLNNLIKRNIVGFQTEKPPVSVIICAKDEAENLRQYLPFVLDQDYPNFEVIVVNDGSTDDTEILLRELKKAHPNLRSTFVPVGATNLSTKKLALTLGIKAASNDWLLFTDADCMPEDKHWISQMSRNFQPGIEIVIGFGAYKQRKGVLNRLIAYDTLFNGLQYMGMALSGSPYMGVGRNMAYRKEMFFRQNGFAKTLHLRSGDDDLLINHSANKFNTKVEVSKDSVTWSEPKKRFIDWYYQKERHVSVSTYYTAKSRFKLSIEPVFRGLFYLSLIASVIPLNLIVIVVASVLFIVRLIVQLVVLNRSAKHFGVRRHYLTVLLFDVFLPLLNLHIITFGRMGSQSKRIPWK